jgi:hypothetical protein
MLGLLFVASCTQDKVDALANPPVINSFTTSAAVVSKGTKVTLSWNVSDATQVSIAQVGTGNLPGVDDKASGTVEATIDAQTLFVLTALNKRGVKTTGLVTVGIDGGSVQAFFAGLPETIGPGQSVTLVWSAPGAKAVTITPAGGAALDLKGQLQSGSLEVPLTASTDFTLDADGTQKTVSISVGQAITEFKVDKTLAQPADMVTLSWKTTGATKLTVSSPGRGVLVTETDAAKMAMGTFADTLPNAPLGTIVPYVLTLEGAAGNASSTAQVVLSDAPVIKTFVAPEYVLLGKSFNLSWTTTNADSVEISTGGIVIWSSTSVAQAIAGTLPLAAPAAATDYTLTAKSVLGGAQVTKIASVKPVGSVSVTTFTATPMTLPNGGTAVTLTWNVPNARRLKIIGSDGHTVATGHGVAAETGTASAYPNAAITYTLDADNTLEAPVTATQAVTVTTPATFAPSTGGSVFAGNPVNLSWTIGTAAQIYGFPHTDVVTQTASTGFVDISTTGNKVAFLASDDDAVKTFTPADFESFLYGNRVTGPVTVSTNGFFVFGSSALTRSTTVAIPNTTIERNFIAPYWTNLELGGVGNVYWQVTGEAPERVLVVQFDKVKIKGDPMSELTFEAKVHQVGVVTFEYKKMSATAALPASVIGIQGAADGIASGGPAANVGITFFGPKSAPVIATYNSIGAQGGFIKLANGYLKASYTPPSLVLAGDIAISEVLYAPNAAIATTGEWFEVTNNTAAPIDLNGWTIDFGGGSTHVIASSVIIPAKSVTVLGQSAAGAANDNVATAYQYGTTFSLAEPAGSLTLSNGSYQATASWNSALANNGGAGVSINVDTQPFLLSTDTSSTVPHSISCAATVAFGAQAPQQLGTPGISKACFGYLMRPIPVSYFDISTTGTLVTSGDDAIGTVSLSSAPVPFFGVAASTATVSTNGWLTLKTVTGSALSNLTVPSTSASNTGAIAPFWDDLDTIGVTNGGVYSKRMAAAADPNNPLPHWIIQWRVGHHIFGGPYDDMSFQVKLFDSGIIEYHYATMISVDSNLYATGTSATVWLENNAGTTALVSSVNKPAVLPNTAIRFTPN